MILDDGFDICLINHPGYYQQGFGGIRPSLAIQTINVEFFGRTAHAAGAPWDGINALDAANIAYSSISSMRQQFHPADRCHGIIVDGGQAPNIIPEHTQMKYYVRSPTLKSIEVLKKKVIPCFEWVSCALPLLGLFPDFPKSRGRMSRRGG